jgi:hypothetical protein
VIVGKEGPVLRRFADAPVYMLIGIPSIVSRLVPIMIRGNSWPQFYPRSMQASAASNDECETSLPPLAF